MSFFNIGDQVKYTKKDSVFFGTILEIVQGEEYPIIAFFPTYSTTLSFTEDGRFQAGEDISLELREVLETSSNYEDGDFVYDVRHGKGVVKINTDSTTYPIEVSFSGVRKVYSKEGVAVGASHKSLSFTDYSKYIETSREFATRKKPTLKGFDWSCLHPWLDAFIAKDADGKWFAFAERPILIAEVHSWKPNGIDPRFSEIDPSYYPTNDKDINFKDSVYINPKYS